VSKIASPEGGYEARSYWSGRLTEDFSLVGVGYRVLGQRFNRWQYKAYLRNLEWAQKRFGFDLGSAALLECGFGTGFFLDYYHRLGNRNFSGVDLTEISVARLKEKYPHADLRCADLGAGPIDFGRRFDIVTAFAVLLHITDDTHFRQAVANVCRHSGDFVLISDIFPERRFSARGKSHYVLRSRAEYAEELARNGFEVVGTVPIFVLLSTPGPAHRWWFYLWSAVLYVLCRTEFTGHLFGALLYWLDGLLIRAFGAGPSTRLLVARRTA
jgi:SAM-dependent methyltransferase